MYAKIFEEIFDSSIADNYELRHFFMDLLVLADCNGIVDRTASAISSRTRIPLPKVEQMLQQLEQPDPQSKNPMHEGRRICRFDEHRTWGWYIVNFARYHSLANERERRLASKERMERHKTKLLGNEASNADGAVHSDSPMCVSVSSAASLSVSGAARNGSGRFHKPTLAMVKLRGIKIELPPSECEKFYDYYESNGWRVGKNPMKLWTAALANWKRHWIEYGQPNGKERNGNHAPAVPSAAVKSKETTFWELQKRLDLVNAEIKAISARASYTATEMILEPQEHERYHKLRQQQKELKRRLGL